jgi:hypothetical protein
LFALNFFLIQITHRPAAARNLNLGEFKMKDKTGSRHFATSWQRGNKAGRSRLAAKQAESAEPGSERSALAVLLPEFQARAGAEEGDPIRLIGGSQPLVRTSRLVVLVPEADFDSLELARRIWRLALPGRLSIAFIALAGDEQEAAFFQQRLTNLAFLIGDPRLRAVKVILQGLSWKAALRKTLQPGDLPVCVEGLRVRGNIFRQQDLATLAAGQTSFPVLVLRGIAVESAPGMRRSLYAMLAWLGSALTMIGFGFLQMRLTVQASGGTLNFFLILSMILEFLIIFKINSWIN